MAHPYAGAGRQPLVYESTRRSSEEQEIWDPARENRTWWPTGAPIETLVTVKTVAGGLGWNAD